MDFIQLHTMAEYRQFLMGHKVLNNFFTPQDIQKYMARDALFGVNPASPVLLYDEKTYYQMCFSSIASKNLYEILTTIDKPIISYIRNDTKQENGIAPLVRCLTESGFFKLQTFHKYDLKIEAFISKPEDLADYGLQKKNCWSEKDYTCILELWNDGIPIYELPFLTTADLEAYVGTGKMIALEEISSGKIVAAACFETILGRSIIRHVVVDKLYRGCGYGSLILRQTLLEVQKCSSKAWAWVADTNIASRKTFEKSGFYITPVKLYQYITRRF